MTPEVIEKLEKAFMHTYTDEEACLFAGINQDTLYAYQRRHPEFVKRKNLLKLTPNMHAKQELVTKIPGNLEQARWWAKNSPTMRDEFGEVTKMQHSGTIGEGNAEDDKILEHAEEELRQSMHKRIKEKANPPKENAPVR